MTPLDLAAAGEILQNGGVVVIPTETVYGLAARADHPDAVAKIFRVKRRPSNDPLIVHIADLEQLPLVAAEIPHEAWELAGRFWPGPLTLVLPKSSVIPDSVTAKLPTVAVRLPDHSIARDVIRSARFPLAAPSANLFGQTSPTRTTDLHPALIEKIDGYLEGGPCQVGVESTIIGFFPQQPPLLLRPGGVPLEEIEEVIGPVAPLAQAKEQTPLAPGNLPSHYAPETPLYFVDAIPDKVKKELVQGASICRLTLGQKSEDVAGETIAELNLSYESDLQEAARNLYKMMIELDRRKARYIIVDRVPAIGLGRAICDRLERATAR